MNLTQGFDICKTLETAKNKFLAQLSPNSQTMVFNVSFGPHTSKSHVLKNTNKPKYPDFIAQLLQTHPRRTPSFCRGLKPLHS